jgi:thioredoxin 1
MTREANKHDRDGPGAYRGHMATLDITGEKFASTIEGNDIVLVDFWAEWCGPCKQFGPTYSAVSEKHPDVLFTKVDTEAEQQLAAEAGITSIPTLMAFREKVLVFSQPGALNAQQLEQVVDAVKALDMEEVHAHVAKQREEAEAAASRPAGSQGGTQDGTQIPDF